MTVMRLLRIKKNEIAVTLLLRIKISLTNYINGEERTEVT